MIRIIAALAAAAIGATAVHAQNTQAIAQRQATMQQYGRAMATYLKARPPLAGKKPKT